MADVQKRIVQLEKFRTVVIATGSGLHYDELDERESIFEPTYKNESREKVCPKLVRLFRYIKLKNI